MKLLAVVVGLSIASVSASAFADDTLRLQGSVTVAKSLMQAHQSEIKKISSVEYEVLANGSRHGLMGLLAGRCQVAMISAPLDDVVKKVNKKRPGALEASEFREFQLAKSVVKIVVHPSNPAVKMTAATLAKILSGRVSNWKEVGGRDLPIVIVAEGPGSGLRTNVENTILGKGKSLTDKTKVVMNGPAGLKVVSQVPGAIGIVGRAYINDRVTEVELDREISHPLVLVTKGEPDRRTKNLIKAARKVALKHFDAL